MSLGATFPVAGEPAILQVTPTSSPVTTSSFPLAQFITRPNARAAGLVDIRMRDGSWVGFSPATGTLVSTP